jgi:hypothetical protein
LKPKHRLGENRSMNSNLPGELPAVAVKTRFELELAFHWHTGLAGAGAFAALGSAPRAARDRRPTIAPAGL